LKVGKKVDTVLKGEKFYRWKSSLKGNTEKRLKKKDRFEGALKK